MKPRIKTPLINLTCLVCLFISSKGFSFFNAPQNGELIITEVVIADNSAYSFIELRNNTESDLELSGVQLKDNTDTTLYTFGSGTLAPGGLIVLTNASDKFTFESNWGTLNSDVLFIVASNNLNITNAQGWSLEKDITIDEAAIGASGQYFLRDVGVSELINTNSNNTASPGELDVVFNGNTDISVLSDNTAAVNVFFNTNTSLPDTQLAAINNMHIANGTTLTINGGLTVNGEATNQGQLVVSSDDNSSGSLIANNQVGDLELTYERNIIYANTWASISSPLKNITIENLINENDILNKPNTTQKYLAKFNTNPINKEFLTVWQYYNDSETYINNDDILNPSFPILLRKETIGKIIFNGSFSNDNYNITLDFNQQNEGWHFIGNPYTSFISVEKLVNDNSDLFNDLFGGIFIYSLQSNSWEPLTRSGKSMIAPGQALLIKVDKSGIFSFNKSQTVHSNERWFGNAPPTELDQNRIRLRINDGFFTRYAYIYHTNSGTNSIDKHHDLGVMDAYDNLLRIYSQQNNTEQFSLQDLSISNLNSDIIIPLGILSRANRNINIKAFTNFGNENFETVNDIILEDRELNIFKSLTQTNDGYSFFSNTEINGSGRFFLHISQEQLSLKEKKLNDFVEISNNEIKISKNNRSANLIYIYDTKGALIFNIKTKTNSLKIPSNINKGVYIIKIKNNSFNYSNKILLD